MKLIFGISAVFLLTVLYLFNSAPSIHTSNEIIQHSNPLQGAQTILENLNQQTLDFTELDTPYSKDTQDTEIAGLIRTDDDGNLIVDTEFKAFMDYFLSSVGQVTPEQALQRLRLHFYHGLTKEAADQAMAVLKNYLAFKEASFEALALPIDTQRSQFDANYRYDTLAQGLETLYDLRRTHLGGDVAQALFVEDEAYAQYTLSNMKADLDESLSIQERQQLKDIARAQLPDNMRDIIDRQEQHAKAMQAYSNLLAGEPSTQEVRDFAFEHFDSEQAQVVVSEYEAQLQLKNKYQAFTQATVNISNQGLDPVSEQDAIRDIAKQYFTDEEYSMVQAWQLAQQGQ